MNDVMLDFETLGNGENKCVCQIGAVYFDKITGELGKEFKINVDAVSHIKAGAKIDGDTVYWWLQQSDSARKSLLENRADVTLAFTQLNEFLKDAKRIWSHATFDFVTLLETLKMLNIKPTFSYKVGLDLRTLNYLAGVSTSSFIREGTHHDALDDCKFQVKYCVAALNIVKQNKNLLNIINRINNE